MRISDWSSDVCSSDLDIVIQNLVILRIVDRAVDQMYPRSIARVSEKFLQMRRALDAVAMRAIGFGIFDEIGVAIGEPPILEAHVRLIPTDHAIAVVVQDQIGRASCRERVCQYV